MKMDYQSQLDALRVEIAGVADEIEWLQDAPLPKDEAKQRLAEVLQAHGDGLGVPLHMLLLPSSTTSDIVGALALRKNIYVPAAPGSAMLELNVAGLLTAIMGSLVVDALAKKIDSLDYTPGPASKDRPVQIARLRKNLFDLEKREEVLIRCAEDEGLYLARRPDANPEIVLDFNPDGRLVEMSLPRMGVRAFVPPVAES